MSQRERWVSLLYNVATGTRKTRTLLTPIGLTIFAAFIAAFVLAALLVDRLLGLPALPPARLEGHEGHGSSPLRDGSLATKISTGAGDLLPSRRN